MTKNKRQALQEVQSRLVDWLVEEDAALCAMGLREVLDELVRTEDVEALEMAEVAEGQYYWLLHSEREPLETGG